MWEGAMKSEVVGPTSGAHSRTFPVNASALRRRAATAALLLPSLTFAPACWEGAAFAALPGAAFACIGTYWLNILTHSSHHTLLLNATHLRPRVWGKRRVQSFCVL